MAPRPRRFKTVAVTITYGQDEYITAQTQGLRDKSRWVRDAISMRMLAEANAQVSFSKKFHTEAMKDALEVAQNTVATNPSIGNTSRPKLETDSNSGTPVEGQS